MKSQYNEDLQIALRIIKLNVDDMAEDSAVVTKRLNNMASLLDVLIKDQEFLKEK